MSFNLSTKLNNLYQVVENIQTTALTNPMVAPLNMNNYSVINANTITAQASTPLTLSANPANGIVVNSKMTIPNHTLQITNNTASDDGLQVQDTTGDTSVFRVDANGNVGIKANPATALTSALAVNGSATISNDLKVLGTIIANGLSAPNVVNSITAGTGIIKTGTSAVPILSNGGLLGLTTSNAGSGIAISGTATAPVIANTGVIGLTSANAGTNITISGTPTAPIITASASPSALTSYTGFGGSPSQPSPAVDGGTYNVSSGGVISIMNGGNGYPAITTNENLWISCYCPFPVNHSDTSSAVNALIAYWNGSGWVVHPSANGSYYYSPRGGPYSGGNFNGDSLLYSYVPSVGGQVRWTIALQGNGGNTQTNAVNVSYSAFPVSTLA